MALKAGEFIHGYIDTLSGACGAAHVSEFSVEQEGASTSPWYTPRPLEVRGGGCGWLTAGFINEPESREMYEFLCKEARLVYQSPVRRNSNSGNRFFFCVFDCGVRRNA